MAAERIQLHPDVDRREAAPLAAIGEAFDLVGGRLRRLPGAFRMRPAAAVGEGGRRAIVSGHPPPKRLPADAVIGADLLHAPAGVCPPLAARKPRLNVQRQVIPRLLL